MLHDQYNGGPQTSPPLSGTGETDDSNFWNFQENQPAAGASSSTKIGLSPILRVATPTLEEMSDCDGETVLTADMSCSPALTATQSHDDDSSHDVFDAALQLDTNRSLKQKPETIPASSNASKKDNKMGNLPQINEKKPTTPLLPSLSPLRGTGIQKRTFSLSDDTINQLNNPVQQYPHYYTPQSIVPPTDPTYRAAALLSDKTASQLGRNSHSWINTKRTPSGRTWNSSKQDSTHLTLLSPPPQGLAFGDQTDIEMYQRTQNAQLNTRETPSRLFEPNLKSPLYSQSNFPYNLQPRHSSQQVPFHSRPIVTQGGFQLPPAASPNLKPSGSPHNTYTQRPPSPSSPLSMAGPPPIRSPPEILKTLLRKKACLYEPGTSRAIALITWHVGRNLALNNGYFSRQHLQFGVHNVVAEKIQSGVITRTKVNRCMQIILNSCFHYIIPRPDGSEERGNVFRQIFSETAVDDSFLLKYLPAPWHDLKFKFDDLTQNSSLISAQDEGNETDPGKAKKGKETSKDGANKRPVLLCFNENVRSAGDIMRCHNEFIRDAANAANLDLTAEDWKNFFLGDDDEASLATEGTVDTTLSGGAVVHSPVPECALPNPVAQFSFESAHLSLAANPESGGRINDLLGQMNYPELSKFRTTWCCKRYDHDPHHCRFAHVDINGGWLRRDPLIYKYVDKLCPHIFQHVNKQGINTKRFVINKCPSGARCKFAHSLEEIEYHPNRYKKNLCDSNPAEQDPCELKDICPLFHPIPHLKSAQGAPSMHSRSLRSKPRESPKYNALSGRSGGTAVSPVSVQNKTETSGVPYGSPMIYLYPAPKSGFDDYLMFPGLRDLFRRNCLVQCTSASSNTNTQYALFGDLISNTNSC